VFRRVTEYVVELAELP